MSLSSVLHRIFAWIHSDKVGRVVDEIAKIVPIALPIVKTIAELTPTRADDEIVAVFAHFAVPFTEDLKSQSKGEALFTLATTVVAEKVPEGTVKNIIQSGVQLAVSAYKADPSAVPVL